MVAFRCIVVLVPALADPLFDIVALLLLFWLDFQVLHH